MIITDHAAERFVERISPGTSTALAKSRIAQAFASAAKLRQKTNAGDCVYLSDSLRCRLVVRESRHGEDDRVVITVLPPLTTQTPDHESVVVEDDTSEPHSQNDPPGKGFDLALTMRDLINGSDGMRTMVLTGLSMEQLRDVRAENVKRTHAAISRKQKDVVTSYNGLAICIKEELRKRQPAAQPAPAIVLESEETTSLVRELRRELGRMLHKYGWLGNEEALEVYKKVKGGSFDD